MKRRDFVFALAELMPLARRKLEQRRGGRAR
jgi:hypothetical protein